MHGLPICFNYYYILTGEEFRGYAFFGGLFQLSITRLHNSLLKCQSCLGFTSAIIHGIFHIYGIDSVLRVYPEVSSISSAPAETAFRQDILIRQETDLQEIRV